MRSGLLKLQDWPTFKEFDVVHDYLVTPNNEMQARVRKRGENGKGLCTECSWVLGSICEITSCVVTGMDYVQCVMQMICQDSS